MKTLDYKLLMVIEMRKAVIGIGVILCFALVYTLKSLFSPSPITPKTELTTPSPSTAMALESQIIEKNLRVKSGQTISTILSDLGLSSRQIAAAIESLRKKFDPRSLRVGQEVHVHVRTFGKHTPHNEPRELLRLLIRPSLEREIIVSQSHDGSYHASIVEKELTYEIRSSHGRITSSLYADASKLGVPVRVISELTQGLSYSIHLQRDIRENDPFEVVYETLIDKESGIEKPGELLYASIGINGSPVELFRFQSGDGRISLYNENGESVCRDLLVTPVAAARLSSPFGLRKDPFQGFSKMHQGVDFAAPRGTPVVAAGDGTIIYAGTKGGYGNYVMINHHNGYKTVYAHLSKITTHVGHRVRQGQVIGAVGSTGRSTGPHLHHEVHYQNRPVNPQKIKMQPKIILRGTDLDNFKDFQKKIKRRVRGLTFQAQYANTPSLSPSERLG